MYSSDYSPLSLPEVTTVEIVLLGGKFVDPTDRSSTHRLTDATAKRLADFYRQLPAGEPKRCHIPSFGLRFFAGTSLVGAASICWKCTNLYFYVGGKRGALYGFDSDSISARSLLAELRKQTGLHFEDVE